jgi:hypothetical protein
MATGVISATRDHIVQWWFHAYLEAHFAMEPHVHKLQTWICTYGEMITAISRPQQRMNQQGQMGMAEAFEHLYNIENLFPSHRQPNFTLIVPFFPRGFGHIQTHYQISAPSRDQDSATLL